MLLFKGIDRKEIDVSTRGVVAPVFCVRKTTKKSVPTKQAKGEGQRQTTKKVQEFGLK